MSGVELNIAAESVVYQPAAQRRGELDFTVASGFTIAETSHRSYIRSIPSFPLLLVVVVY